MSTAPILGNGLITVGRIAAVFAEVAGVTQQTANPGAGDYYPEAAGSEAFSPADSERMGFHVGNHRQEVLLTGAAVVLAVIGAVLLAWPGLHALGGWIALAGIVIGFYAQLTSDTRGERMVNVVAIGVAAVAFAFHIHHGGLF